MTGTAGERQTGATNRRVLHLGSFQPALENALLAEVSHVRSVDPLAPVFVLAPTVLLCQHLKRMLARALPDGHAGVRFVTLHELARLLGARALRSEERSPLPERASILLWRRAVAAMPRAEFFEPIRATRGFATAARSSVRDLKEAGFTPAVVERFAKGPSRLAAKLRDLARLWRDVDACMASAGYHDDLDLLRAAAEVAPEAPPLADAVTMLYGFYDLPHSQRRLITGFLAGRRMAAAFFPWAEEDDDRTFEYAGSTFDFLQGTLGLLPETDGFPPLKPVVPFRVIAVPGESREAMEVARAVAASRGPLHRTGVLMRAPRTQAPVLAQALEDAGIPVFLREIPASHGNAARALRLLLQARREDLPRRVVLEILTGAPVRFDTLLGELARHATPGVWDVMTREWGVVSGAAEWRSRVGAGIGELERRLERLTKDPEADVPPGLVDRVDRARALGSTVERLIASFEAIPDRGPWSRIALGVRQVFDALFRFGPDAAPVHAALDALAVLDGLGGSLAEGTLAEASELIEEGLDGQRLEEGGFEGAEVLVADLMKARGLPFGTVVLPGMVEGVFPRASTLDPLLSDGERRRVNHAHSATEAFGEDPDEDPAEDLGADGPLALKGAAAAEERLLFRLAMDAASESLVFTLPRLDPGTAKERMPSWLLFRLLERSGGDPAEALSVGVFAASPRVDWKPLDPAPPDRGRALTAVERNLSDLASVLRGGVVPRARAEGAARLLARSPFGRTVVAAERGRWREPRFTAYDGWIEPSAGAQAALGEALAAIAPGGGRDLSATRLETWLRCPYQYFLEYGLGLSKLEEPERRLTVDPLERGSLIHDVLERFWRAEAQADRLPLAAGEVDAAIERLDVVAASVLDAFAATGVTGPKVLWEAARKEMVEDLRRAVRGQALGEPGWIPAEFEAAFEGIPISGGSGLAFRGQIDRIDFSADGRRGRVVDYKTGQAHYDFKPKKKGEPAGVFLGATAVQLPIYVLAAKRRFPEVEDWQAVYDYCTRRGEFTRAELAVDDTVLERLGALIESVTADAAAGRYPFVFEKAVCRQCDFTAICGPGHDVAFGIKSESEEFDPFRGRREEYE